MPHGSASSQPPSDGPSSCNMLLMASVAQDSCQRAMDLAPPLTFTQFVNVIAEDRGADVADLMSDKPATMGNVMELMFAQYLRIQRRELENVTAIMQTQHAAMLMDLYELRSQHSDLAQEVRQNQTEEARLMAVLGNWPDDMPPGDRSQEIFKLTLACEPIKWHCWHHGIGDCWKNPATVKNLFKSAPVTIMFNGKYSTVTIVYFKDFVVRQLFCLYYRNHTPTINGKRIRIMPSSPLWARKKECMIRAIMGATDMHPYYKAWDLTPLWHSLTLMEPQRKREYDPHAVAWCHVRFVQSQDGRMECHIYVSETCRDIVMHVRDDDDGDTLFCKAFLDQVYGKQRRDDLTERAAADVASEAGHVRDDTMAGHVAE